MSERPYCRLYWEVMDDPKFDGIREDVRLFGSWALCLVVADMAYPSPAYIPPTVPRAAFRCLVDAGLVDELPGHRFRIHGLEAERTRRSSQSSDAANARWHRSDSNATALRPHEVGSAETMPSRDETRRDEQSRADTPLGRVIDTYLLARAGHYPSAKQKGVIERYLAVFEVTGEQRAIQLILAHPDDPIGALIGDIDAEMVRRKQAAAAQEAESKTNRRQSGFRPGTPEYELLEHWMKGDAA